MSTATDQAGNQKRTTSSAGYRFPGQQATHQERLKLIGGDVTPRERHGDWVAEIVKVQRCASTEYNGGAGYQTLFEYSDEEPLKIAFLIVEGNIGKLMLEVKVNAVHMDPSPTTLNKFETTEDQNLYTIRLFDYKWSMDIQVDPRKGGRGRAKLPGDYWAIHLRVNDEATIAAAKRMLRRVGGITFEMPDRWFKHRNFFTKPSVSASAPDDSDTLHSSQGSATEGAFERQLSGGYKVRWTGALATPMFLRALGHENIRPPRQPSPEAGAGDNDEQREPTQTGRVTRSEAAELLKKGAFRHSTLPLRTKVVDNPKTKKEVAAVKKARKEESRRNRRAALLDPEPVSNDEDDDGQGPSGSPAKGKAKGTEEVPSSDSSDDSTERWPIKGIIGDQTVAGVQ
ncbi:MAG: hypothetical protein Q9195_004990 [Heterodermia aff. obscurata]